MKPLLSVRGLTKSYPGLNLLRDIRFDIYEEDFVGLVGRNGTGKTTLINILQGKESYELGEIETKPDMRWATLSQYQTQDSELTVIEELSESEYLREIKKEIDEINENLADPAFYEREDYPQILERYNELQSVVSKYDADGFTDRAAQILHALKVDLSLATAKVKDLSGGERRKVALAKALVECESSDILVLDEPTNHLDIESREWLEQYLANWGGTCIIISHDRYFLDSLCSRIFEIENKRVRCWRGNFTDFVQNKEIWLSLKSKAQAKIARNVEKEKEIIQKLKARNRYDTQIAHRLKRLEREEKLIDPVIQEKALKFRFNETSFGGRVAVWLENVSKRYGQKVLMKDVTLEIEGGDKVGLIGPNGAGKTTLLKMILGEEKPDSGEIRLSKMARIGYFDQGHLSLDPENNLIEEIRSINEKMHEFDCKAVLGRFGFKGDTVYQKISTLSGGERARMAILKLVLSPCNLLLLDEPTNHLDYEGCTMVESALNTYSGTAIVASHDRYFLDSTCNKILSINNGQVIIFNGNYSQFKDAVAKGRLLIKTDSLKPEKFQVVRKFTDWLSGTKYSPGEILELNAASVEKHKWAIETGRLKRML
ncbi:MAG: ABC-F family ATP-binding cassette domain-containing protein [Thermoplasmata archaeon]